MTQNLQLEFTPSAQFLDELRKIIRSEVTAEISTLSQKIDESLNEVYIDRIQAAKKLGLSLPTFDARVADGTLQGFRIGNRLKFRVSEINTALPKIKKHVRK